MHDRDPKPLDPGSIAPHRRGEGKPVIHLTPIVQGRGSGCVPEVPLAGHASVRERPGFAVQHLRAFLD